jgi:hypothetical protein
VTTGFPLVSFISVALVRSLFRFQLPPVKPCMRFSRTRLTDAVHRRHSASPARACWPWVPQRFRSDSAARTRATGRLCARPCLKRMKPSPGIGLGRPVQRVLQGTHLIQRNLVHDKRSAVGGTSQNGTHRAPPQSIARIDEAVALPSPAVMLSARLDQYYGHLRRPPGWLPLPGSSPVIGHRAPTALRSLLGRGGPLQFPPPLSERSEPPTPGSPSRLHLQDLHRVHGLRLFPTGSALPGPTRLRAGALTTLQASLDVTDRSVAHPAKRDARRWASTPPVSRRHRQPATGPPDSYPDRTYTGKRRRAYKSAINHFT